MVLVYAGSSASSLTNRYLVGPNTDEILADENAAGVVTWSLADNLGTVRDLAQYNTGTNTTTVVNHIKYDTFGQIKSQSNPGAPGLFAYTGRDWDGDAGMYYYRARWYDARVGRFLSEDPIGFAAGDVNLSRYVANRATMYVDPSGMLWGMGAALSGAVIGAAGSGIICIGSSLIFSGELPSRAELTGALVQGGVPGAIAGAAATGDPATVILAGAAGGALGGMAGNATEQVLGKPIDEFDPGRVVSAGSVGAIGGAAGAAVGVGLGKIGIPTGGGGGLAFAGAPCLGLATSGQAVTAAMAKAMAENAGLLCAGGSMITICLSKSYDHGEETPSPQRM